MVAKNDSSMNEELKKWLQESKEEIKTSRKKMKKAKIPSGKCQICGEKNATSLCLKCNRSVCKSCYFKLIGICKKCVPKEIASKWDGSNPDWEKQLGVEWVD
ncbi:MAG: hypothetical protein AYK22_05110 [Thermoplasmatales archaeon SG8-52-3]|nr:MAG: hypothetical protein AYK22_05110 [Thermoplasmatales archaeon SG8-52-3]